MRLRDLTPEAIKDAIEDFHEATSGLVTKLAKTVGNERTAIPRTPRKMGTWQFEYFFAADIDQLARYSLGGLEMARKFVNELCDSIEEALFTCAADIRIEPPAEWYDTPIGFIVRLARARAALRKDDGPNLEPEQVRALGNASESVLKKAGLLKKGGDPPATVREFLESRGQPI